MQPDLWKQIKRTVALAADLDSDERASLLAVHCPDPRMRAEVESLLAALDQHGSVFEEAPSTSEDVGSSIAPGDLVGGLRIVRQLGEGGMGQVFLAHQEQPLDRLVALKILRPGRGSKRVVRRFAAERQALARMSHRNVARVFDAGRHGERPFVVMEAIEGLPIDAFCDTSGLSIEQRLELFIEVCQGVQHAHLKGIIHRDIKPSNVLVTDEDGLPTPKIIDFGIAKAVHPEAGPGDPTEHGQWLGTPDYMSPEQVRAGERAIDTRTDVYSLGVLLYKLLVGTVPRTARDILDQGGLGEWLRVLQEEDPRLASQCFSSLPGARQNDIAELRGTDATTLTRRLRGELDTILAKTLERDPEQRYLSPIELAEDLSRSLRHQPVLAHPPSNLYRLRKAMRRHRLAFAAGGLLTLSLLAAVAGTSLGMLTARRAERVAQEEARRANHEAAVAHRVTDFLSRLFEASDTEKASTGPETTLRQVLDRGAEQIRQDLRDDPLVQAELMVDIGNAYNSLALFEPAQDLYLEAEAIYRQQGEGLLVADCVNNIATVLNRLGDYEASERRLGEALAIQRLHLEPGDLALGDTLHNLGAIQKNLGKHQEALASLHESLRIQRNHPGRDPVDLARTLGLLGLLHVEMKDFEEARRLLEQALEIEERHLGPDHPRLSYSLNNLAMALNGQGRPEEARPLFERALAIDEATYGSDHLNVAFALFNLGYLSMENGHCPAAKSYFKRTLRILELYFEPQNPRIEAVSGHLARLEEQC